jgi:hypothetical protein
MICKLWKAAAARILRIQVNKGAAFFMKKVLSSTPGADALWHRFSNTGKIGAYLTYRAVKQREETEGHEK